MLDPIQYEFRFFQNTLADPEPGAGAETSIFRLQPKVSAPCGSGSTTLVYWTAFASSGPDQVEPKILPLNQDSDPILNGFLDLSKVLNLQQVQRIMIYTKR
jgi:hypothetical protein